MSSVRPRPAKPVFVDRSGRRRRLVLAFGVGLAVLFSAALVALVMGMSGASGLHVPGFPDANGPPAPSDAPSATADAEQDQPRAEAGPTAPSTTPGSAGRGPVTPTTDPSSPRHVPTHSPSHPNNK